MKSAKEYRREAKERLNGKWGWAILTVLVGSAIISASGTIPGGFLVLSGPMLVGMAAILKGFYRKDAVDFKDLFSAFDSNFVNAFIMGLLYTVFTFLWSLLFIIPGIIVGYSYSMAPYILSDNPTLSGKAALDASKRLMKGKKWKLFCLQLSFFGWLLLCMLTLGILTIWVAPWIETAEAGFYESVKGEVVLDAPAGADGQNSSPESL